MLRQFHLDSRGSDDTLLRNPQTTLCVNVVTIILVQTLAIASTTLNTVGRFRKKVIYQSNITANFVVESPGEVQVTFVKRARSNQTMGRRMELH